jgi:hypothetical protein
MKGRKGGSIRKVKEEKGWTIDLSSLNVSGK